MAADDTPDRPAVSIDPARPRVLVEALAGATGLRDLLRAFADTRSLDLLAVGPSRFQLVGRPDGAPVAAAAVREAVGRQGVVVDLTGGYPVLTIDGPGADRIVARCAPLDAAMLAVGGSAATLWHGVPCLVHRTGGTRYEVAVPASYLDAVRDGLA